MAERANIDDVEAIKRLRAAVGKFAEQVSVAVSDAAGEVNKTQQWLEVEQSHKWKLELRKRHEKLQQALEALRMKQLFRGPSGEKQGTADEQHRVKICRAALEEAERKVKAIEAHKARLAREAALFQGAISRLSGIAHQSAPAALAELGNLIVALEKYRSIQVTEAGSTAGGMGGDGGGGMAGAVADGPAGMGRTAEPGGAVVGEAVADTAAGQVGAGDGGVSVEWAKVVERAREAWGRIGGAVVVEKGALTPERTPVAAVVVVRDAFSGRHFVGRADGEAAERSAEGKPVLEVMEAGTLLAALPALGEDEGQAVGGMLWLADDRGVIWSGRSGG